MIAIVWRYEVHPEHRERFEAAYGPNGEWVKLFERSEAFRGTRLMRDSTGAFLTLDHWNADGDFEAFLVEHGEDYRRLDESFEEWTRCEERIGQFQLVG